MCLFWRTAWAPGFILGSSEKDVSVRERERGTEYAYTLTMKKIQEAQIIYWVNADAPLEG